MTKISTLVNNCIDRVEHFQFHDTGWAKKTLKRAHLITFVLIQIFTICFPLIPGPFVSKDKLNRMSRSEDMVI